MVKICQECGLEFEATNGRQKFCDRLHFRNCVICGKSFEVSRYHLTAKDAKTTCSKSCAAELRKRTNLVKYGGVAPSCSESVRNKMKSTTLNKFGVEHAAQSEICKAKTRQTNLQRYGKEYYTQTDDSKAAMSAKWQDVDYRTNVLSAIQSTNLIKYGSISSLGNLDVRTKALSTYKSTTGFDSPLANPEVREKSVATWTSKHGVSHPMQSAEVQNKFASTCMSRFGTSNPMQNPNIQKKAADTCVKKYGSACYLQSNEGKLHVHKNMKSTYGVEYFSQSREWKRLRMRDSSKIDELMKFDEDPSGYILANFDNKPSLNELCDALGVSTEAVSTRVAQAHCSDLVAFVYSNMEREVSNYLYSIDPDIEIVHNTHKIITPYEIDIYLPQHKLGIECNPTSTHNSSINSFDKSDDPIPPGYHKRKTDMCEAEGIFLFHIFGYEWTYHKEIIQSMLLNLLNKNSRIIYARKANVCSISSEVCNRFLETNHRQGSAYSSIRLGLYHEDELVSVMTFGKMRSTIGTGNENLSDCYELVRFCSLLNTSVVGGASKLFKYFVKHYCPVRVRSFSDRSHTRGQLYQHLGFREIRRSDPGYVWVDTNTDMNYHRVNAQKQNIKKFLHDDAIDLSKSEREIMIEHGFVQVFDSGTITWEWAQSK